MNTQSTLMDEVIDYHLLGLAQEFYSRHGFSKIEVPWIVSTDASLATVPFSSLVYETEDSMHLIGSGEQGFIQLMMNENKINKDKWYQTITPCFRREVPDKTHSTWFMKLELFRQFDNDVSSLVNSLDLIDHVIDKAYLFFDSVLGLEVEKVNNESEQVYDLYCNNIEIGSYGFRKIRINDKIYSWIFGTGLALPRTQLCKNIYCI